jgi:signal peptidase I
MSRFVKPSKRAVVVLLCLIAIAGSVISASLKLRAVPVLSGSMRPHYGIGSLVVTHPVTTRSLKVGQVIAFRPPAPFTTPNDAPIMHRVVKVQHMGTRTIVNTRGDANPAPDSWVLDLDSRKTYTADFSIPKIGFVAMALRSANRSVSAVSLLGFVLILISAVAWPTRRRTRVRHIWRFELASLDINID